jgi:hypothetical protein
MLRRFLSKNRKDSIIAVVKQYFRVFVALALVPVCYGVMRSLWGLALGFEQVPEGSFYFLLGFVGYLAFQWVFFKPMRTYVFGHELTHAMAAWLTGGEVSHFHVGKKGGSVTVTKPNLFVALAPYMVPLYALILMGLYFGVGLFYDLSNYWNYFLIVLGASMGFHLSLTVYALKQDQPDLKSGGKLLSGILIFLGNAVFLVFLLGVLFPRTVSWETFLRNTKTHTGVFCRRVGQGISYLWSRRMEIQNGPKR